MEKFEYAITSHPADTFGKVVYFCTERGDCGIHEVPSEEPQLLVNILNERGDQGWELVQLLFGEGGVMACWKRKITEFVEA